MSGVAGSQAPASQVDRARRRREGAVYVEFLIAFPPVLIFFLCLVQLSMIYVGKLSVQHASYRAARAAIVVLPDNPSKYFLSPPVNEVGGLAGFSGPVIAPFGVSLLGGARLDLIRAAAWIPLIPISPSTGWTGQRDNVMRSFDADSSQATLRASYAQGTTAVTLWGSPGTTFPSFPLSRVEPHQEVTTRVTHLYYCSIPLANAILCDDIRGAMGFRPSFPGGIDRDRLAGAAELATILAALFPASLGLDNGHFMIIRAESTLPNQGAAYVYK